MSNYPCSQPKNKAISKGLLVPIGGNENKINDHKILSTIVSLVKKQKKNIEIITTATEYPEEVAEPYFEAFKDKDNTVRSMYISSPEQAADVNLVKRITEADIVFFTGGSQLRITSILGGSAIEKEIHRKYEEEHCIIAGTSAGASVLAKTMIHRGTSEEALQKDDINMSTGLGFIDNVLFDTHFVERGRFSRLMQIVSMNTKNTGVGLGEDAGVIIEGGRILRAIGSGTTVILDGQHLKYTNVAEIGPDEAIAIENIVTHTIVDGHGYDLCEKRYLKPDDLKKLDSLISEVTANENN